MRRTHIVLMSNKEIKAFKDKYTIYLEDEKIYVKINRYENRKTAHSIHKSFVVNVIGMRVVKFTKDTIDLWLDFINDGLKFDLIDVQEKVNEVYLSYQDINKENVLKALNAKKLKKI